MSTVIFLSNREVKAVIGTGGKTIHVSKAFLDYAPEGSIINGQIIKDEEFTDFLGEFWDKNKLPRQDVILALENGQAVTRIVQAPQMSRSKLMEYIPRELSSSSDWTSPVYSYCVMGQKEKLQILDVSVIERSFLENHIARFKKLGIHLSSIVLSHVAGSAMMERLSCIAEGPVIVQVMDGMNLMNLLYVDGKYYQHSVSRVFRERGTVTFGVELAKNVSRLQQFLRTQQSDADVSRVFLGGEFQKSELELYRECIQQMDPVMEVEMLHNQPGVDVDFPNEGEVFFGRFLTATGGLLIPKGKGNLLYEYHHDPEEEREKRELFHSFIPALSILGVFIAVTMYLCGTLAFRMKKTDDQLGFMDSPATLEEAQQYEQLAAEKDDMNSQMEVIDKTLVNLNTYPAYNRAIKEAVKQATDTGTRANVNGYIMETGTVSVEVYSTDMSGIQRLVERLENREDLFSKIDYSGFEKDSRNIYWEGSLQCYLQSPNALNGEVTP